MDVPLNIHAKNLLYERHRP